MLSQSRKHILILQKPKGISALHRVSSYVETEGHFAKTPPRLFARTRLIVSFVEVVDDVFFSLHFCPRNL